MNPTADRDGGQGPRAKALYYVSLGWRVVPVWRPSNGVCTCREKERCQRPGKHPRTPHGWKDATTDPKKIETWKWETANIGIATGRESGLLVLDIDPRNGGLDSINELQAELGKLPPGPRVKTGGGGWHVYLRHPPVPVRKTSGMPGIDIKGDGGFVVAPPSAHVSGGVYEWGVTPQKAQLPDLPESWVKWLRSGECNTEVPVSAESAVASEAPEGSETPGSCRKSQEAPPPLPRDNEGNEEVARVFPENVVQQVIAAIDKTYARGPGQRHDGIKLFVRHLKAISDLVDLPADDLRPFLEEWFKMSLPNTRDKDFGTTWGDFRYFWEECRFPYGTGVTEAFERAVAADPPPCAVQKYGRHSLKTRLAALCRELQKGAGDAPFYLGGEKAGELLEVNSVQGWRWLKRLCADGILDPVSKGSRGTGASEYRYLGD
jgi:hypothetical protein